MVCALACALLPARPAEAGLIDRVRDVLRPAKAKAPPIQGARWSHLLPADPPAAGPRASRVHLLTKDLYARLRPETRQGLGSLVRYVGSRTHASGVLVGAWRDDDKVRGLVLTNHHVVRADHDAATRLVLADGGSATQSRIVAKSRLLDYALLEVELPAGTGAEPATPASRSLGAGNKVHAAGAATSMLENPVDQFVGGRVSVKRRLEQQIAARQVANHPVIGAGVVRSDRAMKRVGGQRTYLSESSLAAAPGSSGGPVFDSKDHRLVGILSAGYHKPHRNATWVSGTDQILRDLAKKHRRGKIPAAHLDTVGALLGEAH